MAVEILSLFWSGISQFLFPILLIFLLAFAILGKTKILGEDTQVLAWVSIAIAIIFVAVPFARNIVTQLVPFLAVMAVIFLIFMILYGFILQGDVKIEGGLKTFLLIVILASLAVAILAATGYWSTLINFVNTQAGIVVNIFIVIVLAIVVFVVVRPGK